MAAAGAVGIAGCLFDAGTDNARSGRATDRVDGEWPMHNGTPQNTRHRSVSGPVDDLAIDWERTVGSRSLLDPIVSDSLVYAFGTDDPITTTIEAATGERTTQPWVDGEAEYVLGVEGSTLYLAREASEAYELLARPAGGDDVLWTAVPGDRPSDRFHEATFRNGTAYVVGFMKPWIGAFDLQTGAERWSFETVGNIGSVAVAEELVAVTTDTYVFGLDATTGDRRWHLEFDVRMSTDPLAMGERTFVGTNDGDVLAFDRDGQTDWRRTVSEGAVNALTELEGTLVAGTSDGLVAVDPASGGVGVRHRTDAATFGVAAGTQQIYAVFADSTVAVFDRGVRLTWSGDLPDQPVGGPVVLDGLLLVRVGPVGTDADHDRPDSLVAFATE